MLTGNALIRIFVSFFPFPSAPLMIAAEKLPLVEIDYGWWTSSDIHINLFRFVVDSCTGKHKKMPRGASSSLATGKILQTNPTTSTFSDVTLVDKMIFIHHQNNTYTHTHFVAYDGEFGCQVFFTEILLLYRDRQKPNKKTLHMP